MAIFKEARRTFMTMTREAGIEIHEEHLTLLEDLAQLDRGLDRLESYTGVFANLAGVQRVKDHGRRLAEQLPNHFKREEKTILPAASRVSPELAEFCSQMKAQHGDLLVRLTAFRAALDDFDRTDDLSEAIYQLKEQGKALTRDLRRHVAAEELELSGFL